MVREAKDRWLERDEPSLSGVGSDVSITCRARLLSFSAAISTRT